MTRDELIAALKAATGPSFVLDGAIDGWRIQEEMAAHGRSSMHLVPRPYTASLDAALTLVSDGCGFSVDKWSPVADIWEYLARVWPAASPDDATHSNGANAAIALCIAAIRARGDA